jgi:hypothetical protein
MCPWGGQMATSRGILTVEPAGMVHRKGLKTSYPAEWTVAFTGSFASALNSTYRKLALRLLEKGDRKREKETMTTIVARNCICELRKTIVQIRLKFAISLVDTQYFCRYKILMKSSLHAETPCVRRKKPKPS